MRWERQKRPALLSNISLGFRSVLDSCCYSKIEGNVEVESRSA